jgi:hypothetical protein
MTFVSANALILTLLIIIIVMDIHPSLSFVPSPSTMNGRKQHDISQEYSGSLIPSQVLRRAKPESSSSMDSTPFLVPSQVLKSPDQLKRQVENSTKMKLAMSASNVTSSVTTFSNAEFLSLHVEASKSKRSRRRTARRKHMKKADDETSNAGSKRANRKKRILMGDLPDIHWCVLSSPCSPFLIDRPF